MVARSEIFRFLRGDLNALLAQLLDLAVQMLRVDDHAVAHNADDVGAQDAGGQQVQHELAALVLDGVAGVVAALIAATMS